MIELIFVIVILGILAAVAIPKLAATRDDAKISRLSMNIETAIAEIGSYAASKGKTESDLSKMSAAIEYMVRGGEADVSENDKAKIKVGENSDCITIEVVTSADGNDKNVTVVANDDDGDGKCKTIQTVIKDQNYNMQLEGSTVTY